MINRGTEGTWISDETCTYAEGSGELWVYEYDLSNRLLEVSHSTQGRENLKSLATYTYDIRGLREKTVKANGTTYYQYDLNGSLVWTEDDSIETKYIQALGQIWAEVRTEATVSKTYYHHTNHLGTTEAITDESGTVIWDASYSAYGEIQRSNGTEDFAAS